MMRRELSFVSMLSRESALLYGVSTTSGVTVDLIPRLKERRRQVRWSLSGGDHRILAISRAPMARPRLLLLDASLGLAPRLVDEVYKRVKRIGDAGLTILVVEQNTVLALPVADRSYVLKTGRVVLEGPAGELKHNVRAHQAYLGR
jgi:branched-chain amino acid transport system ATP-binding protein